MRTTLTTLFLTAIFAVVAVGAFAQTSCLDIQGPTGCAPSPYDGITWSMTGTVYVEAGVYNGGSYYVQDDAGGGITLFDAALAGSIFEGDRVTITGVIGAFGSEIEFLAGETVSLVGAGAATVSSIGTQDLADGSNRFGDFLSVQGVLGGSPCGGGFNCSYTIDDGSGPVVMFVDGTTGINVATVESYLGDVVYVKGSTKCFNGAGEILPRRDSDITLIAVANDEQSWSAVKSRF